MFGWFLLAIVVAALFWLASSRLHLTASELTEIALLGAIVRIPVMWAGNSGDVGRRRSEATLVAFYSSQVAHMSQEKRKFSVH